jgi:type II secretory pathway component PulF
MPRFVATYVSRDGRRRRIRIDAVDRASLVEHLEKRRRAYVLEIRLLRGRPGQAQRLIVRAPMLVASLDSLEFMLMAGVKINAALRLVAECAPPGAARRLWTDVVRHVEGTGSFSGAIRRYPRIFRASMVGIIAAHEEAGRLADGIRQLRSYVVQMDEIRKEAVRGLTYPALAGTFASAAAAVLVFFTLPRFAAMLREIGVAHVNPVTGFFFAVSRLFNSHPAASAAAAVLAAALASAARLQGPRPLLDRLVLRLPVARRAAEALALARICATYRASSESGIKVVESLELCERVSGNAVYAGAVRRVIGAVRANMSVGDAFEQAVVFSPEFVLAVKSGEGNLSEVFGRLAAYYAAEARHRVGAALRLLEPLMLLLVLAGVFGVALAVVLPVVEIINEIH